MIKCFMQCLMLMPIVDCDARLKVGSGRQAAAALFRSQSRGLAQSIQPTMSATEHNFSMHSSNFPFGAVERAEDSATPTTLSKAVEESLSCLRFDHRKITGLTVRVSENIKDSRVFKTEKQFKMAEAMIRGAQPGASPAAESQDAIQYEYVRKPFTEADSARISTAIAWANGLSTVNEQPE